jgi:phosphatidylserine/phosphatidylglycerophosphate/cardiolipin synthase-like enzyme
MPSPTVIFGGPDRPPGCLRDLLAERIAAVPPDGAIDWVTYYFRDRRLAEALIRARARGVDVRVTLDGFPRTPRANERVIALLREALGAGLRVVTNPRDHGWAAKIFRPRLHEKLYCFSGSERIAYIGSFNPSGDDPEEQPDVIREIGDQDRGHNLLVGLRAPELVGALVDHARRMHASWHTGLDRFRPSQNRVHTVGDMSVHFLPRVRADPVNRLLDRCGSGDRVRIAASHLSGPSSVQTLRTLAARGAEVEVLAEATARRVPPEVERRLLGAGVAIRRIVDTNGLPMHAKFALVECGAERHVMFGSFNWTEPSRRFNREIAAITTAPELFLAFEKRWEVLRQIAPA